MAKIHWGRPVSGSFQSGRQWVGLTVPGPNDDAILDAAGAAYTVTSSSNQTVLSIQTASNATLDITGGAFVATNGTNGGVNAGAIVVGDNTSFTIGGGFTNTGSISLSAVNNFTDLIIAAGGATLSGGGQVFLNDDGNNRIYGAVAGATLTNVDNTISGAGQLGAGNLVLVNEAKGVIEAAGGNTLFLNVGSTAIANAGLIEAVGPGGLTILGSTVDDSKGGSILAADGSHVSLESADIIGGVLKVAGSGIFQTIDAGTLLDGSTSTVTNQGSINVLDNTRLNIQGAIDNTGAINLLAVNNAAELDVAAAGATLSGGGQVALNDDGNNVVFGATAGATLTNVNDTISGAGHLGDVQLKLVNEAAGVIDAVGGNALVLNVGATAVVNAGLIEATGAGGLIIQSSTVDDSSGGVILAAAGSHVSLQTADVIGSVVESQGTGVVQTVDGGSQLDGQGAHPVTVLGALVIGDNTALTIQGVISLTQTIGKVTTTGVISEDAVNNAAQLFVGANNATITGGAVTLNDDGNNRISGTLSGSAPKQSVSTLTNKTVISGAGVIGNNLTLINDATIDATGGNALIISTGNAAVARSNVVTNNGLLESANPSSLGGTGGLLLSGVIIANNRGVIEANGAATHVDLANTTIAGGLLESLNGGRFDTVGFGSLFDGSNSAVNNQGLVVISDNTGLGLAGTIDNTGSIDLNAVNNITDLIIASGGATLTGAGQVTLDDDGNNRIRSANGVASLTNVDNTISGAGQLGAGSLALINQTAGVIDATGGNALVLSVGTTAVVNTGLIEATGTGGLTILASKIDDSGGGVLLAATGSHVSLQSADIVGGVLKVAGSGVFQTVDGFSILDGSKSKVSNQGLVNVLDNTALTIKGAIVNTGSLDLLAVNNATDLIIASGGAVLSGGGQVTLNDDGNNRIYGATTSARLTNADDTISGAGQLGKGRLILVNQAKGVIDATGNNALVVNVGSTAVTNAGLMEATGSGGLTITASTIDSSTGGVLLAGAGSHISLQSADIVGGVLNVAGAGFFQTVDGGSLLDGSTSTVTNKGLVDIPDNTALTIKGAIDNIGSIDLGAVNNGTRLIIGAGNATLSGAGHVNLGDDGNNIIVGASATAVLTNVDNVISGAGQLGAGGLVLINQAAGVIDGAGGNALIINTGSSVTTNAGLIEATGSGGVTVQSAISGGASGQILAAAGSHVSLQSAHIIGGVLKTSGTGFFQTVDGGSLFNGANSAVQTQGVVRILDNTSLTLVGVIANSGSIDLEAVNNTTSLTISTGNATLTGGGQVNLGDDGNNRIIGNSASATLINASDTISGAGQLGAGQLTLVNQAAGVIDAIGGNALVINTGSAAIANAGLIEASGSGGAAIQSKVTNTGVLEANGGNLTVNGAVSGAGSALIVAGAIDFTSAFAENVSFNAVAGTLELAQSQGFTGTISGFSTHGKAGSDVLDLVDIGFVSPTEATFSGTASGGTLTVTDGTHTAKISLAGNYTRSTFVAAADGHGGTQITVNATTPIGRADSYSDGVNKTLTTNAASGVLANDVDPNGLALTATLAKGGGPAHGTLTLHADGSFTYTPNKGFSGTDSFSYIASDSTASSAPTKVTINVGSSGGPQTNPDFYGDQAGHALATTAANGVLANDSDPNGLPLTAALAPGGQPSHGTLTLNSDGSFTYTPTLGFAGKDTFSYVASDGRASSAPTLVTITVTAGPPNSKPDSYGDGAGHALTTTAANGVLANDTDPNGLALTAALAPGGVPAHGTLTLNADGSFTYTPTKGFAGKDTFSYIASDSLASGPATLVTLTVTASPPSTRPDSYKDTAGQTLTTNAANGVLANDTDPNGLALTAALANGGGPAHGSLTLNADGSFTYTPDKGFTGTDSFSYIASDSLASSSPTKVTINVGSSGGPQTNPDFYGDQAGHALATTAANGVLANDSDPNGLPLTAALANGGGPAHGNLTLNSDGSFTYTPTVGFAGKDTFSYVASDGVASSAPTLVTITVTASAPNSKPDSYGDGAGHALTTTAANGVLANDTDPNGLALTAALAPGGGPAHGTLTLNADGSFTYTPTAGFAGKDTFSYVASDSLASSAPTTVTIDVTASAPNSKPDSYGDGAGHALTTTAANGVLANDTDPNGLALTAALAPGGGPAHGTLTLNADGSFTYTPTAGFAGKDTFSYVASDSLASSAPTLVTIDVTASPPNSKPDSYGDGAGHVLTTTAATGVLANDTDPNGLALTAALATGGGPAHGTLTLNANGSFTYTPTAGFAGKDSFSYVASDSLASSAPTTVTLVVTAAAPTSRPDSYSDPSGQSLIVSAASGVLANDTDANGLALTAALAPSGGPSHGVLTLNADGSFTYTPTKGFAGKDSFTYIASDSLSAGSPTLVTLTVTGGAPQTKPDTYSAIANQTLTVDAAHGVLANDTDPSGRPLTAALAPNGGPVYGSVTLNADGSFTYILNAGFGGFVGTDTFSYVASDGLSSSSPTLVTIDVSNGAVVSVGAPTAKWSPANNARQYFVAAMAGFGGGGADHPLAAAGSPHLFQPMISSPGPREAFS